MIFPIILSGGMGTRLWPFSRKLQPKQLMSFGDDATLLQDTARRLQGVQGACSPVVICNESHRFIVAEQLRGMGLTNSEVILEPEGRNTAPAIALGALHAMNRDPDAILLVMPADHRIDELDRFQQAVARAVMLARSGHLVVFGVTPRGPETGYGYLRRGDALGVDSYAVRAFVEKPDQATAESYLRSGEYAWNSGMFVFQAREYLNVLGTFEPEMVKYATQAYQNKSSDPDFVRVDGDAFGRCPSNSIDYAVMEKASNVAMVTLDCRWNDLGAWSSVWEEYPKDEDGNVLMGEAMALDSEDTLVCSTTRLVSVVGVKDLAVVETGDAVLVVSKAQDQGVKELVAQLSDSDVVHAHLTVHRPWGSYSRLGEADGFQVKRIVVKPGASLSLQKHHKRSEHWVIVKGVGRITNGDDVFDLGHSGHTFIPTGAVHRLENPGEVDLELIEVQLGAYLGEDDIVRLEDVYGRS